MPTDYRNEVDNIYVDYPQVHKDTRVLFERLLPISPQGIVLIAVGRGGWPTARILAASYEEAGIENYSYSISATYKSHRTPQEHVTITQALDQDAIACITQLVRRDIPLVIIDSVCKTGRELAAVKAYLHSTFPAAAIYTGIMEWVTYQQALRTPWRSVALQPDFYGSHVMCQNAPYVDFPWEHSAL